MMLDGQQQQQQQQQLAVSAPGKVFLAGGYLVLDRAYTALVFGLDARIHVVVQPIPSRDGVALREIEVASPQFQDAVWQYGYSWSEDAGGMRVTQLSVDAELVLKRNVFIETALGYALNYIASVSSPNISPSSVTILADNDYYSNPSSTSRSTTAETSRFHDFAVPLSQAHKTGLGSSAALVTSFTASLLTYYLPKETFDLSTDLGKRQLHNLAQAAHCAAQGKVGSGFDVASAVYGSCLYRRFSPDVLANGAEPGTPGFASSLRELVQDRGGARWDAEIQRDAVKIPAGLRLVMCDVSGGSETPGMVKKVLAWRKERPDEAAAIWTDLHRANEALTAELRALAETRGLGVERLTACFARIRSGIQAMSAASGVPIEPPQQTELIDACERVPGVVGGVVPGAGGYDAIVLLIEDRRETVDALAKLFADWKLDGAAGGGKVSMLGVRQEMEGVRAERVEEYVRWLKK